jgi:type IX secretion system PorP/SprF family membrane protein
VKYLNNIIYIFIVLSVLNTKESLGQDPQFSQFYSNPIYLNPAFAGIKKCPRIVTNYRNQWPGLSANFITSSISFDMAIDKINSGIGLMVVNDVTGRGTLNTTAVSGVYSYKIRVNRKLTIQTAIEGSFRQKNLDASNLTFGDQIDSRKGFIYESNDVMLGGNNSSTNADFSFGAIAYDDMFYGGFSIHHLTQPNEGFINESKLPIRTTIHAGAMINTNPRATRETNVLKISPNIIYQQQGAHQEINIGAYVMKGILVGGIWSRFNFTNMDAVMVLVGIDAKQFKFGYSYDVTTSSLGVSSAGSHEISLGFNLRCKKKKRKFRALSCPSF